LIRGAEADRRIDFWRDKAKHEWRCKLAWFDILFHVILHHLPNGESKMLDWVWSRTLDSRCHGDFRISRKLCEKSAI
jgi:hypothetical protein